MKVGDPVICVDDIGTSPNMDLPPELAEGRQYTIAWIGNHTDPFYEGTYLGVRVAGVKRGVDPVSGDRDKPFKATRFRPLVVQRDDKKIEEKA